LETGLDFARRLRLVPAALTLAALAVLLVRHGEVWDPQLAALNPVPAREQALDAELRSALGASDARYLVAVRGADVEAALRGAERAGKALDAMVAEGRIGAYESPARYLPSAATQAARLASLPDERTLRERLGEALAPLPLRPAKLEAFVADVEGARSAAVLTRSALAGTAFEAALDGTLLRGEDGSWIALLGLRAMPGAAIDASGVRQALGRADLAEASFLDLRDELDRLYGGYLHRALAMSGLGLAAIVLLLAATLRDAGRTARVIVPFVAGAAVVAAAHVLAGTRLNLMHLVGLLLVAAVGSNYALFFDGLGQRERDEGRRTLASLVLANATTVASFALLALSTIPVLHAIGSTVAPGALLTLVFSAAFAAPRPVPR
jgi:predicted exporter